MNDKIFDRNLGFKYFKNGNKSIKIGIPTATISI